MVAMEMKTQDFLFSLPAIKIVKAESKDIAITSTGKCSTALSINFYLPPFFHSGPQLITRPLSKSHSIRLKEIKNYNI